MVKILHIQFNWKIDKLFVRSVMWTLALKQIGQCVLELLYTQRNNVKLISNFHINTFWSLLYNSLIMLFYYTFRNLVKLLYIPFISEQSGCVFMYIYLKWFFLCREKDANINSLEMVLIWSWWFSIFPVSLSVKIHMSWCAHFISES